MTSDLVARIAREWARMEERRRAGFYPTYSDRFHFEQNPTCKRLNRPARITDSPRFILGLAKATDYETTVDRRTRRHIVFCGHE